MDIVVREAVPADAERLGMICFLAFKTIAEEHAFPADFPDAEAATGLLRELIRRPDVSSAVAEIGGRVAGSNFLWEDEVDGVGPITIDPQAQNSRVGRRLMEVVIERSRGRGSRSVRLVQAAYHNRSLALYTSLGFDTREPLSVMQGSALDLRLEGVSVRPATAADIEPTSELCRRVHGHARSADCRAAVEQGTAQVVERNGRLTGYTTGVGFLGHSVGEEMIDVQALIGAAEAFPGPGFFVPTRNSELLRWCLGRGLRIVQPMTLMSMGEYQEPRGAWLPSVLY